MYIYIHIHLDCLSAPDQSTYYIWAYLQLQPSVSQAVDFVIPTGAFGNAASGLVAKRMGLPIGRIVCATNANDVVHRCAFAPPLPPLSR